jgi:hypothetical protein
MGKAKRRFDPTIMNPPRETGFIMSLLIAIITPVHRGGTWQREKKYLSPQRSLPCSQVTTSKANPLKVSRARYTRAQTHEQGITPLYLREHKSHKESYQDFTNTTSRPKTVILSPNNSRGEVKGHKPFFENKMFRLLDANNSSRKHKLVIEQNKDVPG